MQRLRKYLNFRRQELVKNVENSDNPIFGYPLFDLNLESEDEKNEVEKILHDLVLN